MIPIKKKPNMMNPMKEDTNDPNIIEGIETIIQNIKRVTNLNKKNTKGGKDQGQDHLLTTTETRSKMQKNRQKLFWSNKLKKLKK